MARQLGIAGELTFAGDPDLFERAECFAFLGSAGWDEALQARLEAALSRGDVDLLVGNPDISAPLGGAFSAEPGYWALRAMQATGVRPTGTANPIRMHLIWFSRDWNRRKAGHSIAAAWRWLVIRSIPISSVRARPGSRRFC